MNFHHPLIIALCVIAAAVLLAVLLRHNSSFAAASPSKCIVECIRHGQTVARLFETAPAGIKAKKTTMVLQLVGAICRVDAARAIANDTTIYRLTNADAGQLHHVLSANLASLVDDPSVGVSRDEARAATQV